MHFKYSDFDSSCLGRRIATAAVSSLDSATLSTLRRELDSLDCKLGFLKSDSFPRDLFAKEFHLRRGLEITDIKLEFEMLSTKGVNPKGQDLESDEFAWTDVLPSTEFALTAVNAVADRSRFAYYFGQEKARELYRRWVENLRSDASAVKWKVVSHTPSGACAGLIASRVDRVDGKVSGHWELVGISPEFRRRGIGKALATRFLSEQFAEGVDRIRVGTQIDNSEAILFYQSIGFHLVKTVYQFHVLPTESDNE